jgi:uncharacterized protein (TIGR00251 family)
MYVNSIGCSIGIRIKPGTSRIKVISAEENEICIAVTAPPVDGKANEALIKALGNFLDIPKSNVEILRGHTSRIKMVHINGMDKQTVVRLLQEAQKSSK